MRCVLSTACVCSIQNRKYCAIVRTIPMCVCPVCLWKSNNKSIRVYCVYYIWLFLTSVKYSQATVTFIPCAIYSNDPTVRKLVLVFLSNSNCDHDQMIKHIYVNSI